MISAPRYALCEIAFPDTTLAEDIEIARLSGAAGLSVDEAKLGERDPREIAAELRDAGIQAAACIPAVMSFLPGPGIRGSDDVDERVDAMCHGIRRLAALEPTSILCLTGPSGKFSPSEARRLALGAMHRVAEAADEVGVPLSFETFRRVEPQNYSIVFGIEEAVDFLEEAGHPKVPLCYDIWHVWDSSPKILELTEQYASRINVVHLNDYREPTRSWSDRVLPGDGVVDLPATLAALRRGGYDGWFDLEVFSDDGRFGNDYPDSVWKLPWLEQARRGHEGLKRAWQASFEHDAVR
jgi:sugar phosphate isomerase/epimerase